MAKGGNVKLKLNIWCLYISTKILINYFKHLYIPSLNKIKVKDLLTSFFFLICNFTFFFFFYWPNTVKLYLTDDKKKKKCLGFCNFEDCGGTNKWTDYVHFIFMPLGLLCQLFTAVVSDTHTPQFFYFFYFFPQFLHFSSNLIQKSEPVIDHLSFCRRVFDTVKKNPPASPRRSFVKNVFQVTQSNKNYARRHDLFSLFIPFYAWNKFLIF